MTFLWLYASGRYFVGGDAVNVWLSVVTVQIPTYLPMRAVVTNECDGPKRPVVRPVTESDGEILNEIGVLPNENGEPCGGISLGQQVQVAAFVPSILLKPLWKEPWLQSPSEAQSVFGCPGPSTWLLTELHEALRRILFLQIPSPTSSSPFPTQVYQPISPRLLGRP